MHQPHVSSRFGEAPPFLSPWEHDAPGTAALEAHASAGCSACARTLVNAREVMADLALAQAPAAPRERTRRHLLDRTRALLAARRPPLDAPHDELAAAPAARRPQLAESSAEPAAPKQHTFDPSAAVARKHLTHSGEVARVREIDALRAGEVGPGDGTAALLAELAGLIAFPLLFVSIVRGERVGYRVQHGMPASLGAFRDMRRDLSFCTHCVSADAPFIVENAFTEPFFRASRVATRLGVAAYAGVPLRTSNGIVIGTLCALDFTPRPISPETVTSLQRFAHRAVIEIERPGAPVQR